MLVDNVVPSGLFVPVLIFIFVLRWYVLSTSSPTKEIPEGAKIMSSPIATTPSSSETELRQRMKILVSSAQADEDEHREVVKKLNGQVESLKVELDTTRSLLKDSKFEYDQLVENFQDVQSSLKDVQKREDLLREQCENHAARQNNVVERVELMLSEESDKDAQTVIIDSIRHLASGFSSSILVSKAVTLLIGQVEQAFDTCARAEQIRQDQHSRDVALQQNALKDVTASPSEASIERFLSTFNIPKHTLPAIFEFDMTSRVEALAGALQDPDVEVLKGVLRSNVTPSLERFVNLHNKAVEELERRKVFENLKTIIQQQPSPDPRDLELVLEQIKELTSSSEQQENLVVCGAAMLEQLGTSHGLVSAISENDIAAIEEKSRSLMWDWSPGQTDEEAELLSKGLDVAFEGKLRANLLMQNMNVEELRETIELASLCCPDIAELETAREVLTKKDAINLLIKAMETKTLEDMEVALEASGTAKFTSEEDDLDVQGLKLSEAARNLHLKLQVDHDLVASIQSSDFEALKCSVYNAIDHNIMNLESFQKAQMLLAKQTCVQFMNEAIKTWPVKESGRLRSLGTLAATLELAVEQAKLGVGHETFTKTRKYHDEMLEQVFVKSGIQKGDQINAILEMGIEYANDLSLLTEADLRVAGVPRITCRKALPGLLLIGTQVEDVIHEVKREFQKIVQF